MLFPLPTDFATLFDEWHGIYVRISVYVLILFSEHCIDDAHVDDTSVCANETRTVWFLRKEIALRTNCTLFQLLGTDLVMLQIGVTLCNLIWLTLAFHYHLVPFIQNPRHHRLRGYLAVS